MTIQATLQKPSQSAESSSMLHIDEGTNVRLATGALSGAADSGQDCIEYLREFLSGFEYLNREPTVENQNLIETCLKRWLDPSKEPFIAKSKDGGQSLLSSSSDGGTGAFIIATDITGTVAETTMSGHAADHNPMPLWINDPETGEVLYSNPAARQLFGVDGREGPHRITDFLREADVNRDMLENFKKTGRIENLPVHAKTFSGNELWVVESVATKVVGGRKLVIGAIHDLTEQTEIDRENSRALEILQDAIESLSEGFALYDEDRCLVMCNNKYREMNSAIEDILIPGVDWEIVMRESARRGIYSDALGRETEWVSERLESTHHYVDDFELQHSDGSWYLVSTHPTKLGGFAVTRTDITQKKNAELNQRNNDMLVRRVLESSPSPVVMARIGSGEIVYRSPAAQELFGKTENARDLYENFSDRADYITELLSEGRVDDFQVMLRNGEGETFPASIFGRLAEYNGDEVVVTTTIDLTKQLEAEATIRQIVEACPVPIQMTVAETGEVIVASPETHALFGKTDKARTYYADPEERDRYLAELRRHGQVLDRKAKYIRADGTEFWGAVSARILSFKGQDVIVSNTRDLTNEIALQDELDQQREHVFQNEKMSAMGELLAGVAHELNNPLSIVVGHSLMLKEEVSDEATQRRIDKVSSAAERCSKIVKTFLAMARQQPARMEPVDIGSIVTTAVDVASYGQKAQAHDIVSEIEASLPEVVADADQITQVIINLVINAGQAIVQSGTGDRITVSAQYKKRNKTVEIIVDDNGPGIPEAIRARIFEPFFTTKNIGDGTGIGLAFCHRIIHSHGGRIWLDPSNGRGSRFHITLPANGQEKPVSSDDEQAADHGNNYRILVVDDEKDVAAFIAEVLVRDGYRVDVAASGADAVQLLKTRRYDVLLSDLNMPDVDGRGLFEVLENFYPDLAQKTAFITGDTMGQTSQKTLKESGRPFLEKPVLPDDLRNLVDSLIDDQKE